VHFTGRLGREKDIILQRAMVGVVNPSGQTENCPGSALEFAAAGTATVSGAYYGMMDTVIDGETGLLGRTDDDLADNIVALLQNPERAIAMGRNGAAFVKRRYDWQSVTSQWIALFNTLQAGQLPQRIPFKPNFNRHYKAVVAANRWLQLTLGRIMPWPFVAEAKERKSAMQDKLQRIKYKIARRLAPPAADALLNTGIHTAVRRDAAVRARNPWDDYLDAIVTELNQAPATFLRQPTISRTMHPNQQDLARAYFGELQGDTFFMQHILPRLAEPPMGNPYLCDFLPFASPSSMQNAYFLALYRRLFGVFVPDSAITHVTEVGGGYGNLCRMLRTFGFGGSYTIIDLPDMHKLQQHYLAHVLPAPAAAKTVYGGIDDASLTPPSRNSILFGTFSINEMPVALRDQIASHFGQYGHIFIAYNRHFDGVDNLAYFKDIEKRLAPDFTLHHINDPHRNTMFLMARKKGSDA
jgi:hypothetical protein